MNQFECYREDDYEDLPPVSSMQAWTDAGYPPDVQCTDSPRPLFGRQSGRDEEYPPEYELPEPLLSAARCQSRNAGDFKPPQGVVYNGISRPRPPVPPRPLKIACVGPNFRVGGVRQHALSLAKFFDPRRARIAEFLVTDSTSIEQQDTGIAPVIPVRPCSAETLRRTSEQCDVLLMWGDGFRHHQVGDHAVRVFLAHGETQWTRNALCENADIVDHVIAVSRRVHDAVCHGFPTTTILNGVDSGRLAQSFDRETVRARLAVRRDEFLIGSVGRFTREKQFPLLIQAVESLPPQFKLLLTGSGRRELELLELANRCIPGRYAFVPAHDYLGNYLAAMDAFGLVSAHEGFGLVLAEAMMCGRPVFATNVGCVPDVICDRINGVIVQPTAESIADTIRLIHANPQWARGMAAQGQEFASQHLHASRMAAEYEDLLLRLVSDRRASGHGMNP
ncbi:MAG: glycosyltransferase family 4 protein [Planctomycetaceae bacterium]